VDGGAKLKAIAVQALFREALLQLLLKVSEEPRYL